MCVAALQGQERGHTTHKVLRSHLASAPAQQPRRQRPPSRRARRSSTRMRQCARACFSCADAKHMDGDCASLLHRVRIAAAEPHTTAAPTTDVPPRARAPLLTLQSAALQVVRFCRLMTTSSPRHAPTRTFAMPAAAASPSLAARQHSAPACPRTPPQTARAPSHAARTHSSAVGGAAASVFDDRSGACVLARKPSTSTWTSTTASCASMSTCSHHHADEGVFRACPSHPLLCLHNLSDPLLP